MAGRVLARKAAGRIFFSRVVVKMVRVIGKVWGDARREYKLNRISMVGKIMDTITLKIVGKDIILVGDVRKLQTIQFLTKETALIWFNTSRLGLLYTLQQPIP